MANPIERRGRKATGLGHSSNDVVTAAGPPHCFGFLFYEKRRGFDAMIRRLRWMAAFVSISLLLQLAVPGFEAVAKSTEDKIIRPIEAPKLDWPMKSNEIEGNQIILGGNQNNEHERVPAVPVPGLSEEISRLKKELLAEHDSEWQSYISKAVNCTGCNESAVISAIQNTPDEAAIIKVGQLNMEQSVTFGSPEKPVFLIADGINTNPNMKLTVYGTLYINGNFNSNNGGSIDIRLPDQPHLTGGASFRVKGAVHLNSDADVTVPDQLVVGSLVYNNGTLNIKANRIIVENSLRINTRVDMNVKELILVGDVVSNNEITNIRVSEGDFLVQESVVINNNFSVQTGGYWIIGGNLISNRKPVTKTGAVGIGKTLLEYTSYGLMAEYYISEHLSGEKFTLLDPQVNLNGKFPVSSPGFIDEKYSVRWSGTVEAYTSETYTFTTRTRGGVRLWIDDVLLIDTWNDSRVQNNSGSAVLEAGHRHSVRMEWNGNGHQPLASLSWSSPSVAQEIIPSSQLSPFVKPVLTILPTDKDMTVMWSSSPNASGYELEVNGVVMTLGPEAEYVHAPLESGTVHTYRVRANNGIIRGDWSQLEERWTLPGVPENIKLNSTSNSITLTWDEVRGGTSYEIETDNTIVNVGLDTTYTEDNLNPNLQRTFRIRAVNSSGAGKWSEIIAKTTLPGPVNGFEAKAASDRIELEWNAVSGATWYELEIDGKTNRVTGQQFVHDKLQPNQTHAYRIRSGNDGGVSDWSEELRVTTLPATPANVQVEAAANQMIVKWDPVEGAAGYEIEVDGVIHQADMDHIFIHTGLVSNTDHSYRVRALNGTIASEWSTLITKTTLSSIPVNVAAVAKTNEIVLTWDPVIGAIGYDVEVDGVVIDNRLELQYTHSDLEPSSSHTYRVRARNIGGIGQWSEVVTASTGLGQPESVLFEVMDNSITMRWSSVAGAAGYELLVDGEILNVGNVLTYVHNNLEPHSWHVYRVRAVSKDAAGEWSQAYTRQTGLGTPVFTGVSASSNRIVVGWDVVVGATGYDLEVDGKVIDVGNVMEYVHSGLSIGTSHAYRVRAKNEQFTSAWSEKTTRTTSLDAPYIYDSLATPDSISIMWTSVSGSTGYDLEVDGVIISRLTTNSYLHAKLDGNTMHSYRVRSRMDGQVSDWSSLLMKKTISELVVNPGQNTMFNLVVVAPPKNGVPYRTITVTYNPDQVEVLDLSSMTPAAELNAVNIPQVGMSIVAFERGKIVMRVHDPNRTFVNGIRFLALTNNPSKVTYTVE